MKSKVDQLVDMLVAHGNAITKAENGGYAYATGYLQSMIEGVLTRNEDLQVSVETGINDMIEQLIVDMFTKKAA